MFSTYRNKNQEMAIWCYRFKATVPILQVECEIIINTQYFAFISPMSVSTDVTLNATS